MNSSLSFKQAALTFCSHFLLILVDDFLLGPLPTWQVSFNPLSPKINIQILHTGLHTVLEKLAERIC